MLKPFFKTPQQGADTAFYLATSAELKNVSGKYFINRKEQKSNAISYDEHIAEKLWELSEEMTGIRSDEYL